MSIIKVEIKNETNNMVDTKLRRGDILIISDSSCCDLERSAFLAIVDEKGIERGLLDIEEGTYFKLDKEKAFTAKAVMELIDEVYSWDSVLKEIWDDVKMEISKN